MVDQYNLYLHLSLMKGFILSYVGKKRETIGLPRPSFHLSAILSSASVVVAQNLRNNRGHCAMHTGNSWISRLCELLFECQKLTREIQHFVFHKWYIFFTFNTVTSYYITSKSERFVNISVKFERKAWHNVKTNCPRIRETAARNSLLRMCKFVIRSSLLRNVMRNWQEKHPFHLSCVQISSSWTGKSKTVMCNFIR